MTPKRLQLGRVETEVLNYVVEHHPISVKQVAEHMAEVSGQARTTILTVLERLREKKYLRRKKLNGVNHYSPTVKKSDYFQQLVSDFVDGVMQGSVSPVVAYLNQREDLSAEECDQLRKLLDKLDPKPKSNGEKS